MAPSKYPQESRYAAWHAAERESYAPTPVPPMTDAEREAIADAIAARVAASTSGVASGRVDVDAMTRAIRAITRALATDPGDPSEVIADVLAAYGIDVDDVAPAPLADPYHAAPGEYLAANEPMTAGPVPFPTTHDPMPTRPHTGRTIRGRRTGIYVVGAMPIGDVADSVDVATGYGMTPTRRTRLLRAGGFTYGRRSADECHAATVGITGAGIPALIGTDDYQWHEVITYKPERYAMALADGTTTLVVTRPHGSGDSVVGQGDMTTSGRRRPPRVMVMPSYRKRPDAITERTDATGRVWRVLHYRTSHAGRYIIAGDGNGWQDSRRVKRARVKRDAPVVMTRTDAARHAVGIGKQDGTAYRLTYGFADGTRATLTHEPAHRRWRVVLSFRLADGTRGRKMTSTRRLESAAAAIANAPVSHPVPIAD